MNQPLYTHIRRVFPPPLLPFSSSSAGRGGAQGRSHHPRGRPNRRSHRPVQSGGQGGRRPDEALDGQRPGAQRGVRGGDEECVREVPERRRHVGAVRVEESNLSVTQHHSIFTLYAPFIHLRCRIYTYVHPLYMYIHHTYTSKHL